MAAPILAAAALAAAAGRAAGAGAPSSADPSWWASVQDGIRRSEYHASLREDTGFADLPSAWQAPNRAHDLRTYFTGRGIRIVQRTEEQPSWILDLRLAAVGDRQTAAGPEGVVVADGSRVEIRRPGLVEWYVNDERGLEQGFDIASPPPGAGGTLRLVFRVGAGTVPVFRDGGIDFHIASRAFVRCQALLATDVEGRSLRAAFEPADGGVAIRVDTTGARYPVRVDPLFVGLSALPNWTADGARAGDRFGTAVAPAGDVNGDGYSDVLVGAPGYDTGAIDGGRVYLFTGSAGGPGATAAWFVEHATIDSGCGDALGSAGDVNADGYDDVVVGIANAGGVGEARVYLGSATGLQWSAAWTKAGAQSGGGFGAAVASAGDVNHDGYADVLVGAPWYDNGQTDEGRAYLFLGGAAGPATTAVWTAESDSEDGAFGLSLARAGRVNGDAYDDVIIGAPWLSNGQNWEGRAYLFTGNAGGLQSSPAWSAEGNLAVHGFGESVGTAGDVNGDGYDDLAVGAPNNSSAAYVFYGPAPTTSFNWRCWTPAFGEYFGCAAGTAGDVNGDGYGDLIVGAYNADGPGGAYAFYGSATGLPSAASWSAHGTQSPDYFGSSAAAAGDVNGDGYADVIVGARTHDTTNSDAGRAYVFYGASTGLDRPDWTGGGSHQAGARFGYSVAAAGDVNGDGYADMAVGAPQFDAGQAGEGRAYVYHGSPTGLLRRAAWTGELNQAYAQFGFAVGGAGDINGDGRDDLIVGAPYYDDSSADGGCAAVYLGSSSGLVAALHWMVTGGPGASHLGYSVAIAGDVTGDGYDEIAIGDPWYTYATNQEGRIRVFAGSASGVGAALQPSFLRGGRLGANLGESVAGAGDLNHDGYADIVAGASQYGSGSAEGRVFVFKGQSGTIGTIPQTLDGDAANARLGYSVAGLGDVNGDGYADIAAGAYGYSSGEAGEGRAYVYLGCATGISSRAAWTAEVNQAGARLGSSVAGAGDVDGDGYDDVLVGAHQYDSAFADEGAAFLYRGSASGVRTAVTARVLGGQRGAELGTAVAGLGDVNGDGYADYAAGAPLFDWLHPDDGRVLVFQGSSPLPAGTASWQQQGGQDVAWYGASVAGAGDVNGDRYDDVLVGAPWYDHGSPDEGAAFLYAGSVSGVATGACWAGEGDQADAWYGQVVAAAGDVNRDGYDDILVASPYFDGSVSSCGKAWLYHGSAAGVASGEAWSATGTAAAAMFGWAAAGVGDVNGDGFADIAIGAPFAWSELAQLMEGRLYVYTGSVAGVSAAPAFTRESNVSGWTLGRGLAGGDFNRDGYGDIAAGAPGYANGQAGEGALYVYSGSRTGLSASAAVSECNWAGANLGTCMAPAGDVNGDGYADVLAGYAGYASGQAGEGVIWVFYGTSGGLGATPGTALEANQAGAGIGYAVAGAGDFNGDGYADLLTGSPQYNGAQTNIGRALVYLGGAAGPAAAPVWSVEGPQPGAFFGQAVAGAGDVNGDGLADVVVGAPRFANGQYQEGAAFAYYGTGPVPAAGAAWTGEVNQLGAGFGTVVDTAGDVNGDGYSDVLVGAPWFDAGEADEGRVYLYRGSSNGLAAAAAWTSECNSAAAHYGSALGPAGDVNRDGYADIVVGAPGWYEGRGRAYCFHGSSNGLQAAAAWITEGYYLYAHGTAVRTAGDVNRDNYDDVIVGTPAYFNGYPHYDTGAAYVYHGSASGLQESAAWWRCLYVDGERFGSAVGTAGDVNGDGYADVIVGGPGWSGGQGRAIVFPGSAGGVAYDAVWSGAGAAASNAYGAAVDAAGDVNGDGYADVIVGAPGAGADGQGAAYVYTGRSSGVSAAAAWSIAGAQRKAALGTSVAGAGDVNGDGCADVIVGAPGASSGNPGEGLASIYLGSSRGLAASVARVIEANQGGAALGTCVAPAGDVNGDGYADVIVGAPRFHGGQADEGAAFAYLGATVPPETVPSAVLCPRIESFGTSAAIGDFNGDGFADLLVGAPDAMPKGKASPVGGIFVFLGSPAGLPERPSWEQYGGEDGEEFGYSVAAVRNAFNQTRYDAIVVGAPGKDGLGLDDGRVYVFPGGAAGFPPTPLRILSLPEAPGARFGAAVADAGDLNGDGWDEILIGAPAFQGGEREQGLACLYMGGDIAYTSSAPDWVAVGEQERDGLGSAVAGAGDVNGDGFGDFLVGAPGHSESFLREGQARLYYGCIAGVSNRTPTRWLGEQADARLGLALAGAGDVNGDGYADVAVAAPYYDEKKTDDGQVRLYAGAASGAGGAPARVLSGQGYERLGAALCGAGDTDGDGFSDLLVGAPDAKESGLYEGRLRLFRGSPAGLVAAAAWDVGSGRPSAYCGATVAAGDVNGDGYADLVGGSPSDYVGEPGEGRLDLFFANGGPGYPTQARQVQADLTILPPGGLAETNYVGLALTEHPPLPCGRSIAFEWQVAPYGVPFGHPSVVTGTDDWIWFDVPGSPVEHFVTGLSPWTRYAWRLRQRFKPSRLGQPAGPWLHLPWGGASQADFRTFSPDPDGDTVPNAAEDPDGNGFLSDHDTDGDGIADYLDTDDDNDGIPTRYEDTDSDGNWYDDRDGDGIPAWRDADETFYLTLADTGATGSVQVAWYSISGAVYRCQYASNLPVSAGWTNIGSLVTGRYATTSAAWTNQPPPKRFYRVLLQQLPL